MACRKLRCCGCKNRFDRETMVKLPAGNFCGIDCAMEYSKAGQEKRGATKEARARREYRAETARLKKAYVESDLPSQKRLTQRVFNKWVKLRDLAWFRARGMAPECISCGNKNPNIKYDAGHCKTIGSHPELRFDPKNCFMQCSTFCNVNHSGNINGARGTRGYRAGLVELHGQEALDYLDGPHEAKHYTCQELIELRAHYAQLNKELESEI